jgi:hypothetical protein
MHAGRYDSVAALVDPRLPDARRADAVRSERARRAYEAREDSVLRGLASARPGRVPGAPEGAEPPAAVRAWLAADRERLRAQMPDAPAWRDGVSTLAELEALGAAALSEELAEARLAYVMLRHQEARGGGRRAAPAAAPLR